LTTVTELDATEIKKRQKRPKCC